MDGWGTDEDAIIRIMAATDSAQRKKVATRYYMTYKKYLKSELRSETDLEFKDLLIALMFLPEEHDAWLETRVRFAPVNGTKYLFSFQG